MNIIMGNQIFAEVSIPLLWGSRAILADRSGRLSVIDLGGERAKLEIVGDAPAHGVPFVPRAEGFAILHDQTVLYSYLPAAKRLVPETLRLPECQVSADSIRVGGAIFRGNTIVGSPVGIAVSEDGIGVGAPLPPQLAALVAPD